MTDFELRCSDNTLKEYVKTTMMGTTLASSLPMIICSGMLTAVPIIGIIGYFMTKQVSMLILTGCGVLVGVGVIVFLNIMVKNVTAKLKEAYRSQEGLVCAVAEDRIIVVRDNIPQKTLTWDSIGEITEGKSAYFLRTHDNILLILQKDAVLSGSLDETREIIEKRLGGRR